MLLIITIIFFFSTFLVILNFLFMPNYKLRMAGKNLPGPKPWFFIGNGLIFFICKSILGKLNEEMKKYGHVYRFWLGRKLHVVLSDPEDIKIFLSTTKHITKGDTYKMLSSWLGDGLITANGKTWHDHRKILTPTFHSSLLKMALPIFIKNSEILKQKISELPESYELDIQNYVEKCSLDIICESAMGTSFHIQTSNDSSYFNAIKEITYTAAKRASLPWLYWEIIFRLSSFGRRYYRALREVCTTVKKIIQERRDNLNIECNKHIIHEDDSMKHKLPFLDLLLTNGSFTEDQINHEVQTFLFAGHDTTSTVLTFCIYILSNNQEIQDKVAAEIKDVLLRNGGGLNTNSINELKYLENVIKETMRVYSPIPIIARNAEEDIKLPSGYLIPSGCTVFLNLIAMHNREDLFPEAGKFDPNRFEDHPKIHPYSYVPFSAGPRNCIGQKYAMLEMKIILAVLLNQYKFIPPIKTVNFTIDTKIVIRPSERIYIRTIRR